MSKPFTDHFGAVAVNYLTGRPTYPAELFQFLAGCCPNHQLAWDCGTGNGQAAGALADYFAQVIATDASAAQIAQALPHPRVAYRVVTAENTGLAAQSLDLITIAQALHWFDLDRFYAEVHRCVKPDGVIAAWSYGVLRVDDGKVNQLLQHFYHQVIGPYWPAERHHVETGYRELPFPFRRLPCPEFAMQARWSLGKLMENLRSWSATARFIQANGIDPVTELERQLCPLWGDPTQNRLVEWPLSLLLGRIN